VNLESVSLVAIIAAAISGMAVGALWYSPLLFARPWMRALGKSEGDIQPGSRPFIVAALGNLVMAFMLSGVAFHMGGANVRTAVISAVLIWTGFVATTIAVNHRFQG
jgi:O-antigen/teichoic acid export membrane protein